MQVQDLCTTETRSCSPSTSLAVAGWMMWEGDCGALPVTDEQGKLVGIITDRDICMAAATKYRPASEIAVREVFSGKVFSCRMEDELPEALETMRMQQVRRLPVVSGEGQLRGMLSLTDIVMAARPDKTARAVGCVSHADLVAATQAICRPRTTEVRRSAEPAQRSMAAGAT